MCPSEMSLKYQGQFTLSESTDPWVIYHLSGHRAGHSGDRLFCSMRLYLATLDGALSGEFKNLEFTKDSFSKKKPLF